MKISNIIRIFRNCIIPYHEKFINLPEEEAKTSPFNRLNCETYFYSNPNKFELSLDNKNVSIDDQEIIIPSIVFNNRKEYLALTPEFSVCFLDEIYDIGSMTTCLSFIKINNEFHFSILEGMEEFELVMTLSGNINQIIENLSDDNIFLYCFNLKKINLHNSKEIELFLKSRRLDEYL